MSAQPQPTYERDPFESDQPRYRVVERVGNPTAAKRIEVRGRWFDLEPEIDGISLLEFAASTSGADEGDEKAAAKAVGPMLGIIREIFVDYPSFREFSREQRIGIEELGAILGEAVGLYSGRPTQ